MTMSKTAAIRQARTHVGMPIRRSSTDYVVYAPYHYNDPDGPTTEIQTTSYAAAMGRRARAIAAIALHYMGKSSLDADAAMYYADGGIDDLIQAGLQA